MNKICPRCGASFECQHGKACWCMDVNLTNHVRDVLKNNYSDCLCRRCLEELTVVEERPEAEFSPVTTSGDIKLLAALADEVWHEYFTSILTVGQIDYMVDKFQSEHALADQLASGYEYWILRAGNVNVGYTGVKVEDGKLFLSKLYVLKPFRGLGYSSAAFRHLETIASARGLSAIWLTVNRHNQHTIDVYLHRGFKVTRTQVADIGNGYVMDDYIMEKEL